EAHKFLNIEGISNNNSLTMDELKSSVHNYFCNRENIQFYFDRDEKKRIIALMGDSQDVRDTTLNEAENLIKHKIKTFGSAIFDFGDKIDWSLDVLSGQRWLFSYYKNGRMFRNNKSDILYSSKLHWHQHMVVLAKAYLYSGDFKYL